MEGNESASGKPGGLRYRCQCCGRPLMTLKRDGDDKPQCPHCGKGPIVEASTEEQVR